MKRDGRPHSATNEIARRTGRHENRRSGKCRRRVENCLRAPPCIVPQCSHCSDVGLTILKRPATQVLTEEDDTPCRLLLNHVHPLARPVSVLRGGRSGDRSSRCRVAATPPSMPVVRLCVARSCGMPELRGFRAAKRHVGDRGRSLRARDPDRQQGASRPAGSSLSPVTYEQWITEVVKVVETVGTGIMVIGGLGAFLAFLRDAATDTRRAGSYERLRRNLGRCILLGLRSAHRRGHRPHRRRRSDVPERDRARNHRPLIRILLSFSLDVEIDGVWPWNRLRESRNDQAP